MNKKEKDEHTIKVECKDCHQVGELQIALVFKSGVPTRYLKQVEKYGVLCADCFNIFSNRPEAMLDEDNYIIE